MTNTDWDEIYLSIILAKTIGCTLENVFTIPQSHGHSKLLAAGY